MVLQRPVEPARQIGTTEKANNRITESCILRRPSPPPSFPPQLNFHREAELHADVENLTGPFRSDHLYTVQWETEHVL